MEATIYYFTGTGNSLAAARALASGLGGPAPTPIARLLDGDDVVPDAEVVGLVYPVHHWGVPDIVLRFAAMLRLEGDACVFAVATYGGRPGRAFHDLDKVMRRGGHRLDAGFHLRTVQNYVPVFPMRSEGAQRRLHEGAEAKLDEIVKAVREGSEGEAEHWPRFYYIRAYYLASRRAVHRKDRYFSVNDACTSCGTCADVCPVGNISMEDGIPSWLHRCEQCFACLHWCPEEAIDWGGATRGRGRYHHPEVSLEDMMAQAGTRKGSGI